MFVLMLMITQNLVEYEKTKIFQVYGAKNTK